MNTVKSMFGLNGKKKKPQEVGFSSEYPHGGLQRKFKRGRERSFQYRVDRWMAGIGSRGPSTVVNK